MNPQFSAIFKHTHLHIRLIVRLALLLSLLVLTLMRVEAQATQVTDISSRGGGNWEFRPEGGSWKAIDVPAGGWRAQGYTCDAGTYRTSILIPANAHGKVVRLAFSAVNFGAQVSVGPDAEHLNSVATHVNGWMPFQADVTQYAKPGQKLMVQVEVKGRKKYLVNGKYTVPEAASWCPTLEEGILRGVALELLPPVHIDDVFLRTKMSPDFLQAEITVTNNSDRMAEVALTSRISPWQPPEKEIDPKTKRPKRVVVENFDYPRIPNGTVTLNPGETRTVDLGNIAWTAGSDSYWWPNVPYKPGYRAKLHLFDTLLSVNGKPIHTAQTRFGFRQFMVRGNHYELNGIRCNLRGDNQQEADFGTDAYGIKAGFGPPTATNPGWPQAVDNLLHLNFNVMRIHQVPATPYMLDVCDEMGLLIVDESPLRGSEGMEDFVNGHDNMLNMDRELVRRDRNHAAVVIWSAANEWSDPIREAIKAITLLDTTRPIIADGIGDMGPDVINMQHYVNGLGGLPTAGGSARTDRPYGETEAVWDMDNTWQGFAWMATSVRTRRLKGNADLRNYVLNNAWSNYVPGESAATEILEKKVKNMGGNKEIRPALTDPWKHPLIQLMQQCYHPVAACDVEFDRVNARSNENGDWPTIRPRILANTRIARQIAVFNDEFVGNTVAFHWELRSASKDGPKLDEGTTDLLIAPGEFRTQEIAFAAPKGTGLVYLLLNTSKNGETRFTEDKIAFTVVTELSSLLPDGDYKLTNQFSHLTAVPDKGTVGAAIVQRNVTDGSDVWHVTNVGNDDILLTNKKTGLQLAINATSKADADPIVQLETGKESSKTWHITDEGNGNFTLTNRATGKMIDDFRKAIAPGSPLVQYGANGGDNQYWQFLRVAK